MDIQRNIISQLLDWKNCAHRQPLILQGARQIGKSWSVQEFGRLHYDHIAVFNFDRQPELISVFQQTKDIKRILRDLSFYTGVPIVAGKTLIFFDEIQEWNAKRH